LAANLVFDSGMQLQAAPMRCGTSHSRIVIYAAGTMTAWLEVRQQSDGAMALGGQISGGDAERPTYVWVRPLGVGSGGAMLAATNSLGYFALLGLAPSSYQVAICREDTEIEIAELDVRPG
jgi:hypothetical protein